MSLTYLVDQPEQKAPHVLLALSGGVDSAAAALLLLARGWSVTGATLRLFDPASRTAPRQQTLSGELDRAAQVARQLNIPHHIFDLSVNFQDQVIGAFIDQYRAGRTPNPCVVCNRLFKFGALMKLVDELGLDGLATGHYARIRHNVHNGRYEILRGKDRSKDQSYVLYGLSQTQLARVHLPLGELSKKAAREQVEAAGLISAKAAESQDICFIPDGDYARFIEEMTGEVPPPGPFLNVQSEVIGQHRGIIHYTVGQRKGLGIAHSEPLFVKSINPADNSITLATSADLHTLTLTAEDVNWVSIPPPAGSTDALIQIRYHHQAAPGTLHVQADGSVRCQFVDAQRAITPGQVVVFYEDQDRLLGGGTIAKE